MGTNLQDDETAEATRLFGKNVADSPAMIPAGAAPHSYVPNQRGTPGSHAISGRSSRRFRAGLATGGLGGDASTTEFTDAVIDEIRTKLDVWATL